MLFLVQRVIIDAKKDVCILRKNACMCQERKDDGYEFQKTKKKQKTQAEQGDGVSYTVCLGSGNGSLRAELEKAGRGGAHR